MKVLRLKLDIEVSGGQVLKSATFNAVTSKVDEIVDEVNKLPEMNVAIRENRLLIDAIKKEKVDIPQGMFDDMKEAGLLDPTKEYNTYEE